MREFSAVQKLMGSAFELRIVHENEKQALQLLELGIEEIRRIEDLLSEFKPGSEISKINERAKDEPVEVDGECFELIRRAQDISKLTKGTFDISVGRLKEIYAFKKESFRMPDRDVIQKVLRNVGFEKVVLDDRSKTVGFRGADLKLSLAAIGKGYASDQVKKMWQKMGVQSGYINASGDLSAFGCKADGTHWNIGIANPDDKTKMILFVPVINASVATSGDYEQYFTHQGVRFSHNIDPRTGLPLTGIKSVSIFSPSAELSDALATAVYVMGSRKGIDFVNQLPQTHAIVIDEQNNLSLSKNLNYEKISA